MFIMKTTQLVFFYQIKCVPKVNLTYYSLTEPEKIPRTNKVNEEDHKFYGNTISEC